MFEANIPNFVLDEIIARNKATSLKESQARDIAFHIVDFEDTDITAEAVQGWASWDVYEWIESWGFTWNGKAWVATEGE